MAPKLGFLALMAMIAAGVTPVLAIEGGSIDGYRWRSRLVVLAAPDAADPLLQAQRETLASASTQVSERDLVIVEAVGDGREARALRRRLALPDDAFRVVLIGKDGGAKLSSDRPITPETLFSTIDAMPMRRDEMKR